MTDVKRRGRTVATPVEVERLALAWNGGAARQNQGDLLLMIGRHPERIVPGQSRAIVAELAGFLAHRGVMGWVLLASILLFSSLHFTVLESALPLVFHHR